MQLDKQIRAWCDFVKYDVYLNKKLRIDNNMCRILLSNKKIYNNTRVFSPKPTKLGKYQTLILTKVAGKKVKCYLKYKIHSKRRIVGMANYCFGYGQDYTFAGQVKQMKYLSEFLATFPSFVIRRAY